MTEQAAQSTAAAVTLSGRELARQRRQAMARHGKTAVPRTTSGRPAASAVARNLPAVEPDSAASTTTAVGVMPAGETADGAELVARLRAAVAPSAARARRAALSRGGKAALGETMQTTRPVRARRAAPVSAAAAPSGANDTAKGCGCGCNGAPGGCGAVATLNAAAGGAEADWRPALETSAADQQAVVALPEQPTGRALARARRAALARDGKAGLKRVAQAAKIAVSLPGQDWQSAIVKGATGRQIAMQRRRVLSLTGRAGEANAATRPTGRMRARKLLPAPPKVEEGHTLSGRPITGTQVERSPKVTGNEPGSCRVITGTEYIGLEQFQSICGKRPEPGPAKVGASTTLRAQKVTGTEVGRSAKVTGDEPGSCRIITGTEYLSAERYEEFCATRPQPVMPPKVGVAQTDKGKVVTGTQVGRSPKVTGDEPGADRVITGTRYTQAAPDTGPDKVIITHTAGGKPVTGTAVGRSVKITGDEPGACRGITGTQYLALEQFEDFCKTEPPKHPRKVSVMSTRGEHTVTGTEVGRSPKVTGDEPGSCRHITGTQYFNARDFEPLCAVGGPRKVGEAQTLAGQTVTGTEVGRSPKVTGDEPGGCAPVTGTDYTVADPAVCPVSTPIAPVAKVQVDRTLRGVPITGSAVGRSPRVTGDEYGGCAPISGTPYIGRSQYAQFCATEDTQAQLARVRDQATIPAAVVTGDRPGAGGSVMTGDERGACAPLTGTPYLGPDTLPSQCATAASGRFVPRARTWEAPPRPPAPIDFSIKSPAREAWERRMQAGEVTGTAYGGERITGPVNKAQGLITGTPEFRHLGARGQAAAEQERIAAALRVTGEGHQGPRITGDAWHPQSRVTGTEGSFAQTRNPSLRGEPRGAGVSAQAWRDIERPPVPESRITGSAGNTSKGAIVTYSGGARG
ncbi:MAG: CsoS2 family carboxysome shell protein [Thiobacillaceae bacterium]|nr:CsoS2 family carboxysome shell protein [Thiobacillaceae bacterium]